MDFKAFPKIEKLDSCFLSITQKIHGTNAQIVVFENFEYFATVPSDIGEKDLETILLQFEYEKYSRTELLKIGNSTRSLIKGYFLDLKCGSRNRWITPEDDNYGFASFVHKHKEEFIQKLGVGTHFGEWAGPGINSGEGLTEKTFVLFDYWRYFPDSLPPQTVLVPVLHKGEFNIEAVSNCMEVLRREGSKLVPGFMRPEGVVVSFGGVRYKKVFKPEETSWKQSDKRKKEIIEDAPAWYFQPIRLEKLLSRDEAYLRDFPRSLNQIVLDYWEDLKSETSVDLVEEHKSKIFQFVKFEIRKRGESHG